MHAGIVSRIHVGIPKLFGSAARAYGLQSGTRIATHSGQANHATLRVSSSTLRDINSSTSSFRGRGIHELEQRQLLRPYIRPLITPMAFAIPAERPRAGNSRSFGLGDILGKVPWQLLTGQGQQSSNSGNSKVQEPQPDPRTGVVPWTMDAVTALEHYWESRGIADHTQLQIHVSQAEWDPMQRDLGYVRNRMEQWDALKGEFPDLDVNRIVRSGPDIIHRSPDAWKAKVLLMYAAYAGIDWAKVMGENPTMAYMPQWQLSRTINDWAETQFIWSDSPFM